MDMDHDMHDSGLGMDRNYAFARDFWYIIAGVVGSLTVVRGINCFDAHQRISACHDASVQHPTRPKGPLGQAWATATAIIREVNHPQLYVPINGLRWATPPSLGRVVVLLCYWAVVIYLMSWKVSIDDLYYWERIGYRNAWISIMQFPLLYLLAMKVNVIGLLINTSHERLNWLHRWVARTMFVTATVHGFHFWTEWVRADFVEYELQVMPLVRYGLGAWGVLLWTVVTGFVPIRRAAYEVWLVQHVISSIIMIWLLYRHIPENARYHLWMAISFLAFDRAARWALLAWQNTRIKPNRSSCRGMKRVGHHMAARAVGPSTTVVTIKDVHFKWKAGQHIYLWVPRLGPFEAHPYTIACAHRIQGTCCCNSVQLIIRAHGGFSKRLYAFATKNPTSDLIGFVAGPYGVPPRWDIYETLILIGASTGASFTVPVLEGVALAEGKNCVKRVEMVLVARTAEEIQYYVERAQEAGRAAKEKGVAVRIHVAITGASQANILHTSQQQESTSDSEVIELPAGKPSSGCCCCHGGSSSESTNKNGARDNEKTSMQESNTADDLMHTYAERPDIEALIRGPVEEAWGETAVVVCGGREIVSRTRNFVSRLSDERAVHKGTGAQGIYLHVEEYSF